MSSTDHSQSKFNGFFIDVGCSEFSCLLEHKYHWSGILIDANENIIQKSKQDRPNIHLLHGLTWSHHTYLDFEIEQNNDNSGRVCNIPDNIPYKNIVSKNILPAYTIEDLCKIHNINLPSSIDYLSLNVNGSEIYILKQILQQNTINISNISVKYINHRYLQKLLELISNYNVYIVQINDSYLDISYTKRTDKAVWVSDRGFFSIAGPNKWYGYFDGRHIDNLMLIDNNEHCNILSNGLDTFSLCYHELYSIVSNNYHKITDGKWFNHAD